MKNIKNNKLISVLQRFAGAEWRQFAKFVRSPLHNQHKEVLRLFGYLRKAISGSSSKALQAQKVFEHLYPGEAFEAQKLNHLYSYLLKVTEAFLAWRQWQSNPLPPALALMQAYQQHQLSKAFYKTHERVHQLLLQSTTRDTDFFRHSYQLQYFQYQQAKTEDRTRDFPLQQLSDAHDVAYISEKLRNACILLSHQAVMKKSYDMGLLDAVLEEIDRKNYQSVPAIRIYYHAYLALSNTEISAAFEALKLDLQQHYSLFKQADLRDIYMIGINFCIRRINMDDRHYLREVFDLYRSGLEVGVFLENGQLSRWTYNNIIIAALKLKEFDWTYRFIFKYKTRLPLAHQESSFSYNLARYYFEKGDFEQSMPLLLQMEYDDLLHNLGAKTMLAKMYYQLGEAEALDNLLNSFGTYIRRKKGLAYHKENYLNIIALMRKLLHLNPYDSTEKAALLKEVQDTHPLTERLWLLAQLA